MSKALKQFEDPAIRRKREETNTAWRGIGMGMFLITPIFSWAAATVTLEYALKNGWPIPVQILGNPVLPALIYQVPILSTIAFWFSSLTNFYALAILTILFILVLSGILSFIYSALYRMNVPRYTEIDAPPTRQKSKRYKR